VRIELKRNALLIVPESDADRAYIEDTLNLNEADQTAELVRVDDVTAGFHQHHSYVLRVWTKGGKAREEGKEQ
jgi:hypothetical protein